MRDAPKSDESLIGYLVRLTESNYYDDPSWILSLAGAKYRQMCAYEVAFKTEGWLGNLAALTNTKEHELVSRSFPVMYKSDVEPVHLFFGHPLYKYLIRPDRSKVCPDCLKEFAYCRGVWDMMLTTACPLHNKVLIDECPNCRRRIPYIRKHISLCSCGYDFRSVSASPFRDEEIGLARQLHRLCGGVPAVESNELQQLNPLHSLTLIDLATAIVFISSQLKGLFTLTGKKVVKSSNNAQLHKGFTEAYRMFDNFPYNYYEFLEQRQRQDEKAKSYAKDSSNNLGERFGRFYQGLHTHLSAPCFDFMRLLLTITSKRFGASEMEQKVSTVKTLLVKRSPNTSLATKRAVIYVST